MKRFNESKGFFHFFANFSTKSTHSTTNLHKNIPTHFLNFHKTLTNLSSIFLSPIYPFSIPIFSFFRKFFNKINTFHHKPHKNIPTHLSNFHQNTHPFPSYPTFHLSGNTHQQTTNAQPINNSSLPKTASAMARVKTPGSTGSPVNSPTEHTTNSAPTGGPRISNEQPDKPSDYSPTECIDGAVVLSRNDCRRFMKCYAGHWFMVECPNDRFYNLATQACTADDCEATGLYLPALGVGGQGLEVPLFGGGQEKWLVQRHDVL